ncbi:MAG: hypothetical protein HQK55_13535, partial [Deltaproteobacteria bacterium]|nr:hypothetical protein [Deltaproteobacteria bacterium]
LGPEHLSCYQLTVEPGTLLHRLATTGQVSLPDEELARECFLLTAQYLESQGYIRYEVSNFARGPNLVSRHNSNYWNHTPYLGLGPAAHSYYQGTRWWNHRSVRKYHQALCAGQRPVSGQEIKELFFWLLQILPHKS